MMIKRALTGIAILLVPALLSAAPQSENNTGWSFTENFQGTTNSLGLVTKANSTLAYRFNAHIQTYAGLPLYLVRQSATTTNDPSFMAGIGNAFTGVLLTVNPDVLHYTSDLALGAPTGDRSRGFSTGHATVNWTNTVSHTFGSITPYGSAGAGNTVSDTAFFVRPFTTNGLVGHLEGGALFDVGRHVTIGGSAYILRAHGSQEVVSKVETEKTQPVVTTPATTTPVNSATGTIPQTTQSALPGVTSLLPPALNPAKGLSVGKQTVLETQNVTTVTADDINDQGFSSWLSVRLTSASSLQIGYSRSESYQFNNLFFGIGFRAGH
jgi:hypothetical protein